jgi:hypothetical protein
MTGEAISQDRGATLTHAGADTVTTQLAEVTVALRATPRAALPN